MRSEKRPISINKYSVIKNIQKGKIASKPTKCPDKYRHKTYIARNRRP